MQNDFGFFGTSTSTCQITEPIHRRRKTILVLHQRVERVAEYRTGEEMPGENALYVNAWVFDSRNEVIPKPGRIVLHPGVGQFFGFLLERVFHDFRIPDSGAKAINGTPPQSSHTP